MSMVTVSRKSKRVYARKFDHDLARELRIVDGWTYKQLRERFGVSETALRRVVDPEFRAKLDTYQKKWGMGGVCRRCRRCATRLVTHSTRRSGLCPACWSESRQTRFRLDERGQLVAIRCSTCKRWRGPDLFASSRSKNRGKRTECRECGTKLRQAYRERHKLPCVGCGRPALPASEKRTSGGGEPRCRACYYESRREQASVRRERA